MKLLYVTARWDPKDPDSGSGVNYNAYTTLREHNEDIRIAGPFQSQLTLLERGIRKLAGLVQDKRFIKFYPSYVKHSNQVVQNIIEDYQPDVIVSKASIPLVNVDLNAPLIYICDSTVKWTSDNWPLFSKTGSNIMERWEAKVIKKATHIITFSRANAEILEEYYKKPANRVTVHPIPSSLPKEACKFHPKPIGGAEPVRLLLVGKDYHRKGVDIAIDTTQILNQQGIPAELHIVGQGGTDSPHITFKGLYAKRDPGELEQYMDNYRWAHFLLFPSRFDAAGIVPSEAAGFGVPTITNAAGGIATTVEDGVSGVVLEKHSPAAEYARVIQHYYQNSDEYQALCQTTYMRYQAILNWDHLGELLFSLTQQYALRTVK